MTFKRRLNNVTLLTSRPDKHQLKELNSRTSPSLTSWTRPKIWLTLFQMRQLMRRIPVRQKTIVTVSSSLTRIKDTSSKSHLRTLMDTAPSAKTTRRWASMDAPVSAWAAGTPRPLLQPLSRHLLQLDPSPTSLLPRSQDNPRPK